MLSLISLLLIPVVFAGCLIITSNNYIIVNNIKRTNKLRQIILLEEISYIIPYVLLKYYSHIINLKSNLIPSLITTSFWYENMEYIKNKEFKIQKELKIKILKRISLTLALILYGLIMLFWFKYRRSLFGYQLLTTNGSDNEAWSLDISLGVDGVSMPFLALIGFVFPIVYLSNWSTIDRLDVYYHMIIISLELFLIVVFLVIDLIMFYVFFESILPPLFVLIGLYGATQKFRAGYYLFLYTLLGSLFMLLTFVKLGGDTANSMFEGYDNRSIPKGIEDIIWIVLFISFSVKTPLVPVHIWLPLAHSDANVSGSIILASIVLKLALYGFIRILIAIFFYATIRLTPFFLGLCCTSVVYSSLTTIRQFDLKVLVAYSSVAHMSSSLLGTFSDTLYGLIGSMIFGIAHGFVSPGLFIIVGAILYDRCGSRIINYYRGLNGLLPLFALLFLLLIFGNMGVPLTGNFIGEFMSLLGAYHQNIFIASIGALSIILSAVYSVYMYNRVTSGSVSPYIHTLPDIFRKEYYILIPLIILTIVLGVYPSFISSDIEFGLSNFLFIIPVIPVGNSDSDNENNTDTTNNSDIDPLMDNAPTPAPTPESSCESVSELNPEHNIESNPYSAIFASYEETLNETGYVESSASEESSLHTPSDSEEPLPRRTWTFSHYAHSDDDSDDDNHDDEMNSLEDVDVIENEEIIENNEPQDRRELNGIEDSEKLDYIDRRLREVHQERENPLESTNREITYSNTNEENGSNSISNINNGSDSTENTSSDSISSLLDSSNNELYGNNRSELIESFSSNANFVLEDPMIYDNGLNYIRRIGNFNTHLDSIDINTDQIIASINNIDFSITKFFFSLYILICLFLRCYIIYLKIKRI